MAHDEKRGSGARGSHLRVVEKIVVKASSDFHDRPERVLDLPILPVLSRDDEEYAATVAQLVAQG
jgi:hypothetical protein